MADCVRCLSRQQEICGKDYLISDISLRAFNYFLFWEKNGISYFGLALAIHEISAIIIIKEQIVCVPEVYPGFGEEDPSFIFC